MKTLYKLGVTVSLVLLLATFGSGTAMANSITGGISFAGQATPSGGTDWSSATGVGFQFAFVTGSTQDLALAAPAGTFASFSNFTFSPSLSPTPVAPLWTAGVASFALSQITGVEQGGSYGSNFLQLTGTGILSMTGYSDTAGSWIFNATGANGSFGFSASNGATSVPEPMTLLLSIVGLGGLGLVMYRERRKVGAEG